MAVTSFIERVKKVAAGRGISDRDLGMDVGMGFDTGMGSQTPFSAPGEKVSAVDSDYLAKPELALEFLKGIYGPLKRHYDWFRRTQRGQIKQYGRKARSRTEAYRWRGRSEQHVLTSGMDDYPRGPPHAGELHLDLMSWVAFFSRTMKDIAAFVGEKEDEETFIAVEKAVLENLEGKSDCHLKKIESNRGYLDLHWNEEEKMYCDLNVNEDGKLTACSSQVAFAYFPTR